MRRLAIQADLVGIGFVVTVATAVGMGALAHAPAGSGFHQIQRVARGQPGMIQQSWYVMFPHWTLVLALVVPPVAWIARRRRECWRARSGRCAGCGYHLRASPNRCPECGTLAEAKGSN